MFASYSICKSSAYYYPPMPRITWAQSTYGSFVGSIVDPAGAAVP